MYINMFVSNTIFLVGLFDIKTFDIISTYDVLTTGSIISAIQVNVPSVVDSTGVVNLEHELIYADFYDILFELAKQVTMDVVEELKEVLQDPWVDGEGKTEKTDLVAIVQDVIVNTKLEPAIPGLKMAKTYSTDLDQVESPKERSSHTGQIGRSSSTGLDQKKPGVAVQQPVQKVSTDTETPTTSSSTSNLSSSIPATIKEQDEVGVAGNLKNMSSFQNLKMNQFLNNLGNCRYYRAC